MMDSYDIEKLERRLDSQQHIVNGVKALLVGHALRRGLRREHMGNLLHVSMWLGSNEEADALELWLRSHPDTYGERDSTWVELARELIRMRRESEVLPRP